MNKKTVCTNRKHCLQLCAAAVLSLFLAPTARADCSLADTALKRGNIEEAVAEYSKCAVQANDEEAQFWLGHYYQNKPSADKKDKMKMLLFYHLAAENGNANAQVDLAKILLQMDSNDTTRDILLSYIKQMKEVMGKQDMPFKGEILHPYILLMLAAEEPNQKWYYPTIHKTSDEARLMLQNYQITEERKASLLRSGSQWKQRKIQETAKEVLTKEEYNVFMTAVYPNEGRADAFVRQQAIGNLKERVEEYLR